MYGGSQYSDDDAPRSIRFGVATPDTNSLRGGGPSPIPVQSPGAVDGFCRSLEGCIGIPVTGRIYADYASLLAAINDVEVDLAWLPPVLALRTASAGRTLPLALPVRGGVAHYSSALFAPAGSRYAFIQDLGNSRVAWVDRHSTAGYVVIRAWLRSQSINPDTTFFAESFHGSHQAVVHAVMTGAADVGATFAHVDWTTMNVISAGWGNAPVQVVALAGPIPIDVIAASVSLPVSAIRIIRHALIAAPTNDLLRATFALMDATGFVAAESSHVAPLMGLLKHLGDEGRRAFSVYPPGR